jgi:hypothetical protein
LPYISIGQDQGSQGYDEDGIFLGLNNFSGTERPALSIVGSETPDSLT